MISVIRTEKESIFPSNKNYRNITKIQTMNFIQNTSFWKFCLLDTITKTMLIKTNIKKILVPLDGSKSSLKGLDEAIYLARQCSATITGLCVFPSSPPVLMSGTVSYYKSKATHEARKFFRKAKTRSAKNGIVFNQKIIFGVVTRDIVNFANKGKFDLIVMRHNSHRFVRELFLGSVTNSTVHISKIPVLVVK